MPRIKTAAAEAAEPARPGREARSQRQQVCLKSDFPRATFEAVHATRTSDAAPCDTTLVEPQWVLPETCGQPSVLLRESAVSCLRRPCRAVAMAMSMLRRMTPRKRVRSGGSMGPRGGGSSGGERLPFTLPVVERGSRFTAAGPQAPTLVVDLDDTLLQRRGVADTMRLYAPFPNSNSGVMCPYAGEAMAQLAAKYRVVRRRHTRARTRTCDNVTRARASLVCHHSVPRLPSQRDTSHAPETRPGGCTPTGWRRCPSCLRRRCTRTTAAAAPSRQPPSSTCWTKGGSQWQASATGPATSSPTHGVTCTRWLYATRWQQRRRRQQLPAMRAVTAVRTATRTTALAAHHSGLRRGAGGGVATHLMRCDARQGRKRWILPWFTFSRRCRVCRCGAKCWTRCCAHQACS